jgi:hypothetical protein
MTSYGAGRPTVDDVARLLRARTKDQFGNEVGTFDADTRPTADQVDEQIDASFTTIAIRLPPVAQLADELLPALAAVVALHAACLIEKSYFPEQVNSDRSAYAQLVAELAVDMQALSDVARGVSAAAGPGSGITMVPVGSWTSIP